MQPQSQQHWHHCRHLLARETPQRTRHCQAHSMTGGSCSLNLADRASAWQPGETTSIKWSGRGQAGHAWRSGEVHTMLGHQPAPRLAAHRQGW